MEDDRRRAARAIHIIPGMTRPSRDIRESIVGDLQRAVGTPDGVASTIHNSQLLLELLELLEFRVLLACACVLLFQMNRLCWR